MTQQTLNTNSHKKLFDRYIILLICFALAGIVIFSQLINLQIINGAANDELSQKRLLRERNVMAARGNILDRNNTKIATTRLGFSVSLVKTSQTPDQLNDVILRTLDVLQKNGDDYRSTLAKYLTFNPIAFGSTATKSPDALQKWKREMVVSAKDISQLDSAESVFNYFRKVKFKISDSYTPEQAYKIMTVRYEILMNGYSSLNAVCLATDVSEATVAEIGERHDSFNGIVVDTDPIRKYVDAQFAAHVLGYIGNINEDEFKKLKNSGYFMNDVIGKSGVELATEDQVRGKNGLRRIEVDTQGRLTDAISQNSIVQGNNVVLSLDMNLQKVAMESLERNINLIKSSADYRTNFGDAFAGAVVALDVNSGEVLAMASYPSFDPSVYAASQEDTAAQKVKSDLQKDKTSPMLNRAIQGIYTPGSTYKPITAIAGLEEGIITPDTIIHDSGTENIGGWIFKCMEYRMGLGAHGDLKLERALATSCNIFFHALGFRSGIDNLDKWAKAFGLGEPTGIDIPGESKGIRANKETKPVLHKNDTLWRPADTAQAAIGQFDNMFTPLQLANYMSTMANGGKLYTPHVIKKVINPSGAAVWEAKPTYKPVSVKPESLAAIKKGMVAVTNAMDGTAVQVFKDFPFEVAGKTGTPETGGESTHSSNALFTCYAPADNPKIALAVVIERGVWGSNAAPVAKDVLAEYFGMNK